MRWALGILAGCSFTFMHGSERARCQLEAPVTDTVLAAAATVVAVVAATSSGDSGAKCVIGVDCHEGVHGQPLLIPSVAIGVVEAASATYGFVHRSGCSARTDALAAR